MRSNNKLKLAGIIMSVLLILTAICGVSLIASATEGEENVVELTTSSGTVGYKTFEEAVAAAEDNGGGKLTLLADYTVTEAVILCDHVYELELNGKTLTNENTDVLMVKHGAELTITDSVGGGKIATLSASYWAIYNYGTLTLDSVTVTGAGGIFNWGDEDDKAHLTVTDSKIESTVYSAIDNRGTATITNVEAGCTGETNAALENHGTLTVHSGNFVGAKAVLIHGGTLDILGGNFWGTKNGAIYMLGGEVNVFNGSFIGNDVSNNDSLFARIGEGATLTVTSGIFPGGITTFGADIASIIAQGSALYDTNFVKTEIEGGVENAESDYFYVYPDCAAIVTDSTSKLVESFDSVNDAIEFLNTSVHTSITLLSSTDEDITIPYFTSFVAGHNELSGNVTNYGNILEGIFSGKVTNYGAISRGIFEGEVVVMSDTRLGEDNVIAGEIEGGIFNGKVTLNGGEILGGTYNCEVVLETGSTLSNDGSYELTLGDNFKLTNKGGTINCTSHIGEATCIDPASCLLCGESFGDPDPDGHVEGTAATCLSYAICDLCGEEYGELGDHSFGENGKCTVSGCEVVAEVRIGGVFYTTYSDALLSAVSSDMIVAVRDFEIDGFDIPANITFDGGNFTVTIGEDYDVSVCGTIIGGTFVVSDGRTIGVEAGGVISGGSFYGDVLNSGIIYAGDFLYGGLYNNPDGVIENNGGFVFGEDVSFEDLGGYVSCGKHIGGEATCMELAVCMLCESTYGELDPDGHKWLDATIDAPKTCELCGATESDSLHEETTTETPETTVTEAPETTVTETPETTVTETPDTTVTEAPDTTVTETPETTVTEAPETTVTEEPDTTVTEAPDTTVTEAPDTTEEPEQTDGDEQTTTDDSNDGEGGNKKKGCKGMVGIGAVAIVVTVAVAGFVSFKKKED